MLAVQALFMAVEQLLDAGAELAAGFDVGVAVLIIQTEVLAAEHVGIEVCGPRHVAVGAAFATAQELGDHFLEQGLAALHRSRHDEHLACLPPVGMECLDGALQPAVEVHALVMLWTGEEPFDERMHDRPRAWHGLGQAGIGSDQNHLAVHPAQAFAVPGEGSGITHGAVALHHGRVFLELGGNFVFGGCCEHAAHLAVAAQGPVLHGEPVAVVIQHQVFLPVRVIPDLIKPGGIAPPQGPVVGGAVDNLRRDVAADLWVQGWGFGLRSRPGFCSGMGLVFVFVFSFGLMGLGDCQGHGIRVMGGDAKWLGEGDGR